MPNLKDPLKAICALAVSLLFFGLMIYLAEGEKPQPMTDQELIEAQERCESLNLSWYYRYERIECKDPSPIIPL